MAVPLVAAMFRWIGLALTPHNRFGPPHPVVVRMAQARTAGAVAVAVTATLLYTGIGLGRIGNLVVIAPLAGGLEALPGLVLGMAVLLWAATPPTRARLRVTLRRPILTWLGVAGGYLVAGVLAYGVGPEIVSHTPRNLLASAVVVLLGLAVLAVLTVYVLPGLVWATYLAVRHWFNAADGHPMLPALTAVGFALCQLGVNIYLTAVGELDERIPLWFSATVAFGGPLVLVGISAVELGLLHRRGISPRTLP